MATSTGPTVTRECARRGRQVDVPEPTAPSAGSPRPDLNRSSVRERLLAPRISFKEPISFGLVPEIAAERYGRVPIYLNKPLDIDPLRRTELDYVEWAKLVEQTSGALAAAGVRAWDKLVVVKKPHYDALVLAAAAARLGAIPVNLSARLDGRTLEVLFGRLRSPFIFTDEQTMEASGLPASRWGDLSRGLIGVADGGMPFEDLFGADAPAPTPRRADEPFLVTHTSSTTGLPKLVQHSVAAASSIVRIETMRWPFGHSQSDLLANCISPVHVRGAHCLMAIMACGTKLMMLAEPDDKTVVRLFAKYRPSMVETHPNTWMRWEKLCDHPSEPFANVRIFFNTFDAAHPRTIKRVLNASKRRLPIYSQGYGVTEVGVVAFRIYTRRSARRLTRNGTNSRNVGRSMPGTRFRIVDPKTRRKLPSGKTGMIQASTKAISIGFLAQPDKYFPRKDGRWFDTGDYGRRTRLGALELLDREVDRIDGVDSCIWLEDILLDRLPQLSELVVVPDKEGRPVPVVTTHADEPLEPAAWHAAAEGLPCRLAEPVQVPETDLPRTATAKARRFILTERVSTPPSGELEPAIYLRDGA